MMWEKCERGLVVSNTKVQVCFELSSLFKQTYLLNWCILSLVCARWRLPFLLQPVNHPLSSISAYSPMLTLLSRVSMLLGFSRGTRPEECSLALAPISPMSITTVS